MSLNLKSCGGSGSFPLTYELWSVESGGEGMVRDEMGGTSPSVSLDVNFLIIPDSKHLPLSKTGKI